MKSIGNDYSVLMSVYYKEKSEHLRNAMDSIWGQTIPTNDFVLVCDGPLNSDLYSVIEDMEKKHHDVLTIVKLEENLGLGKALNVGLKYCKNEMIARMDSDDISRPNRCEQQLKVFDENPQISICSGTVEEFTESVAIVDSRRVLPEQQEEILSFAKKRNPFNHPCVMYKKSAVENAGGYQDFYLLEDYFLWIRMLQNGCLGYNIQEPLLWMRAGADMYKRRAGVRYLKSQQALFRYMFDKGFISKKQYYTSVIARSISSATPNKIRTFLYRVLLRK